jgi:hypothetical protein
MTTDTRIESLETQVRTLKRMLFGVFGLVVVGGLLAVTTLQSVPDVEVVAGLGSDEVNGGGVLGINNRDGGTVAGIYADENGGVARVLNNKFTEVVQIGADANGDGRMKTSDSKGQTTSRIP